MNWMGNDAQDGTAIKRPYLHFVGSMIIDERLHSVI